MFNCHKIATVEYYLAMGIDAAQSQGLSPHAVDDQGEQRDYVGYLTDNGAGDAPGTWMRFSRATGPSPPLPSTSPFALCEDGAVVSNKVLRRLSAGKDPETGKVIAKLKRLKKGEPAKDPGGYDCQMSQSKGLSVASLLLYAEGNAAGKIDDIHQRALRKAYQWAWDQGLFVTRKDGKYEPVREIAMATFKHSTSRAEDPQEHTHGALMKTAVAMDGSIVQLDNYLLKKYGGAIGAIYRCEEARLVKEELGLALERSGRNYEIVGFPPEIITLFSKRRAAIEKMAAERGVTTAEARQVAQVLANQTRDGKLFTELAELRDRWDREIEAKGWSRETIIEALNAAARLAEDNAPDEDEGERRGRMDGLVMKALDDIMQNNAVFTQATLYKEAFEALQVEGVGADEALAIVTALEASGQLVRVETSRPEPVYTTAAMIAMEQEVVRITHNRKNEREFIDLELASNFIEQRLEIRDENGIVIKRGLNAEQAAAVLHAAGRDGQVGVQGAAGTGKSFSTRVTKELYEAQGYTAYGCAPSWKATNVLRHDAGLDEDKVFATAKILNLMIAKGELKLNDKCLLIVDEAGMVGTEDFLALQRLCADAGAKLLFQGDDMQYGSVAAGGPFSLANRASKPAKLVNIQRQKGTSDAEGEWMRAASIDFSTGTPEGTIRALEAYDAHGMIEWSQDSEAAIDGLIEAYMSDRMENPGKSQGITTQWNADGQRIAEKVRQRLREEGLLSQDAVSISAIPRGAGARAKALELSVGDDIVFGESVKLETTAIRNNDLGRIVAINAGDGADPVLSIVMEDGREIVAKVSELVGYRAEPGEGEEADEAEPHVPKMQHAYAMTGHGFQGVTVDRHYDIVLNSRGAQGTYVCSTRHRESFRMFVDCERIADGIGARTAGTLTVGGAKLISAPEEDDTKSGDDVQLPDVKKAFFAEASGKDEFGNVADHVQDDKLLAWAGIEQPAPAKAIEAAPSTVAAVQEAIAPKTYLINVRRPTRGVVASPPEQDAPSPIAPLTEPAAVTAAQAMKDRMEQRKTAPEGYRAHYKRPNIAPEEFEHFRRQDLAAFAEREGMVAIGPWESNKNGSRSRMYQDPSRADGSKVSIAEWPNGKWTFATREKGVASGDITKFVEWKDGTPSIKAAHQLRDYFGTKPEDRQRITKMAPAVRVPVVEGNAATVAGTAPATPPKTVIERRAIIAQAEGLWRKFSTEANEYLVKVRGISEDILRRFSADIRTTSSGTAAFAHRDLDGRITGMEYKGATMQADGKRYISYFSKGGEKNFTQIGERQSPTRIYITESTVDTLSLYQHDGAPEGSMLASFYGNTSPQALDNFAEFVRRHPEAEIHLGFDADRAGKGFTAELVKRLDQVRESTNGGAYVVRDPSEGSDRQFKDWNDRLRDIDVPTAEASKAEALAAERAVQAQEAARLEAERWQAEEEARRNAAPSHTPYR